MIPDERARELGAFQIDQIDLFEWIRVDSNGMEVRQTAIIDGQPPDPLTKLVCDEIGCKFVSLLQANFFQLVLPTPAPTESPTQSPTTMAPTISPPPFGFDGIGEGYCTDNAGNKYDFYQATNYQGTHNECPGQCSTLGSLLSGFPEQVRAYEHDGVGCSCLVDGGFGDRGLSGYTFTKAAGGTSAVSAVVTFQPQVGIRCYRYTRLSYSGYISGPPTTNGTLSAMGSIDASCADTAGSQIDFIAIYDGNQLLNDNPQSCLSLCETLLGTGFLGITVIRNAFETVAGAAYTGTGNFQCQCHVPLNGPSDPRIANAQAYPYPSGQGFASASTSQPGTVVARAGATVSVGALCYGYAPPNLQLVGEGWCNDNEGNQYDFYQPANGGGFVTDCPDQCEGLADLLWTFPEAVRGFEYDGPNCRCLVDSGFGDRAFSGYSFFKTANTDTSAISPIVGASGVTFGRGISCFKHQFEMYRSTVSYSGYIMSRGSGYCTDSSGSQQPDVVALYDVNQRNGYDSSSCITLCEAVIGMGLIGISIVREPDLRVNNIPYTGLGNLHCQCHVVLDPSTDDPRIEAAQTYPYPSEQGFAFHAKSGAPATAVSNADGAPEAVCYVYSPPSLSFVGEGRCTDDVGNAYEYYETQNSGYAIHDCPARCQNLADQLDAFPEAVRGFEYNGARCRCLVDSGYGDRSLTLTNPGVGSFRYEKTAATAVSAISPIIAFTPVSGWSCYRHNSGEYNDYITYPGYLSYSGAGYCADNGIRTDVIALYDVNQRLSSDPGSCTNLCTDILGSPSGLLGVTLSRTPTVSAPMAPYTGLGNYRCNCHVQLSGGATDPKVLGAQSYAYSTGQGYAYSITGEVGATISNTVAGSTGESASCYRYIGTRRELAGDAAEGHDLISSEDDPQVVVGTISSSIPRSQEEDTEKAAVPRRVVNNYSPLGGEQQEQEPTAMRSFEPKKSQHLRRSLQEAGDKTTIGGAGVATLKFARRVYRRNLLTGEDGWTTKTHVVKRKLQASSFNLELEVQLVDFQRYRPIGSSAPPSCRTSSTTNIILLVTSALTSLAVLLGGI